MKYPSISKRVPGVRSNAKVVWSNGTRTVEIPEMYNKPWALCRWFVRENKMNTDYSGGKLCVVSM